ncbi:hypothetical protein [Streptomyces xanthochromogenes]
MGSGESKRLSQPGVELYARITLGEQPGPGDGLALAELVGWGLVSVDADTGTVTALDPQDVMRRRLDVAAASLAEAARDISSLPAELDPLSGHFERSKWWSGPGSEFLAEPEQVNARIAAALDGAHHELLTAQPGGPRTTEHVRRATERDGSALARGVSIRSLYLDTVRDDAPTRGYASMMTRKGAQFRTLASPFRRMVIVDRRQAFISEYMVPDAAPHAARHVKDRGVIAFIVEVFEDAWRRADVWEGEGRVREAAAKDLRSGVRTNRRQREILRDTALGIPQNRTAKRLGIGLRTLTKELGEIRDLWGVTSLPELTYRWALSPDRLIDDDGDDKALDADAA